MIKSQISPDWKKIALGDIAEVKYGKARPKLSGTIPVVGSGGIYGFTSKALVDFPTIIIGRKGTAGLAWLQEQPCWPSDTTFYLIWKTEAIDYSYIYFFLKGHPLSGDHAKTTLPSILKTDLENYPLSLPSYSEQRAIARVLRAVQAAKETRLRELALERERKAALMEHLFTHGTRGEATKQTEIGEVPNSWQVLKLKNVIKESQYGLSLRGNPTGSYPILRMNNLIDGFVNDDKPQYVELSKDDLRKFRLNRGDLLFNRTNSSDLVGKTGLFDIDGDYVFASYLIRIITDINRMLPEFLNCYLNRDLIQNRLRLLASRGVSQSNINATKLQGLYIPQPLLQEQQEITNVINTCHAKIAALEREIALHDELFKAMLEELMTGRLSTKGLLNHDSKNPG